MKVTTFDKITITTGGALAVASAIGGFYNPIHFAICAALIVLIILSIVEYKNEKKNGNKNV